MGEQDMPQDRQLCMAVASAWVQLVEHLVAQGVVKPDDLRQGMEAEAGRFDALQRDHAAQFTRLMAEHIGTVTRYG